MKKIILAVALLLSVNLLADKVHDGYIAYKYKDYKLARIIWEESCDAGNLSACYNVAQIYSNGLGTHYNELKAAKLYYKVCSHDARACTNLGILLENGTGGVIRDYKYAAKMYHKGCDGGDINGCYNLASSYYRGRGVIRDLRLASAIYDDTCNKGHLYGCYYGAKMHKEGKGIRKDKSKAKKMFAKACNMGHNSACRKWERLNDEGVK